MKMLRILTMLLLLPLTAGAGQVEIRHARLVKQADSWTVHVTLRHADTGWDHYADAWQVETADGTVLGKRTLFHPHVDEQPFTRSLGGLHIPPAVDVIYIRAHDKVHGWNPQRMAIDLRKDTGAGYEIQR